MAYILVGDAGWASMQADCHRLMKFLIEINNGFAQNPNYDFHAFRAAVDGIVRDEIGRRTAQPVINALHRYVNDNLQGEYELEELLDGPLVPRTPLRLPLTHDNIIRHQAELGETVR